MSERVIVTTAEVTEIYRNLPDSVEVDKKAHADSLKEMIKDKFNADDVVVTNVQEFQLQGLRDQMDDDVVTNVQESVTEEKIEIEDRAISENEVMIAVQKVLIELGFEPLGKEVNMVFDAIEKVPTLEEFKVSYKV